MRYICACVIYVCVCVCLCVCPGYGPGSLIRRARLLLPVILGPKPLPAVSLLKHMNNQIPEALEYKGTGNLQAFRIHIYFLFSLTIGIQKEKECFADSNLKALLVTHAKLLMWVRLMTSLVQMQKIRMCLSCL